MPDADDTRAALERALAERFGETFEVPADTPGLDELARAAAHRSRRKWTQRPVDPALLRVLLGCAFSAPSKSDLQQADVIHLADRAKVKAVADLIPDMPWINDAPVVLVFCGNARRFHQLFEWRGRPFANEHLDAFFNPAVDGALVLMNFIRAADAAGLTCCPISAVRNRPREVSAILGLPDYVFPIAGLCAGYPAEEGRITPRLPLAVTVHTDTFDETGLAEKIAAYDRRRHGLLPYRRQRGERAFGKADFYGWSEDKARQYAEPAREDWGAFVREKKFRLD